jgi:hypothetical protein
MTEQNNTTDEQPELPPQTAPEKIPVSLRCFDTEDHAKKFGDLVAMWVRVFSSQIDMSNLDGITIAFDYNQALLDLDRGYETKHKLTPSDEFAFGVAMTPAVIRDGKLKSHMLFNASVLLPLEDETHEGFQMAVHTLAHECAHVEVTQRFDTAFPDFLLRTKAPNMHFYARWEVITACWDEYAVTWICAPYGADPTAGYEETFIRVLNETRPKANRCIKAYRLHANVEQIMSEVYGAYGELMRFACYHIGNMAGRNLTVDDLPKTKASLDGHWFKPHFERIGAACKSIAEDYGKWTDQTKFEALGDIVDEIVREGGLSVSDFRSDGGFYVNVPFTAETMPDWP